MPKLALLAVGGGLIATGLLYPSIQYVPVGGGSAYTGILGLASMGPVGGAGWKGVFELNPDCYAMVALMVLGVILIVLSFAH